MLTNDDTANPWILVEVVEKFDCPYYVARSDIVRHGTAAPRAYNSVRMKFSGIGVVPIDAEGCTVLVGQYRFVLDRFTWEITRGGGALDRPPLEAAKDELSEETGYSAQHWLQLYDASCSPGTSSEMAQGFVAWGLHPGEPHPEPEEKLVRRRLPFAHALDMALTGEIADLGSIALLFAIRLKHARGELPRDLAALLDLSVRN